jgi:hypothetical protein
MEQQLQLALLWQTIFTSSLRATALIVYKNQDIIQDMLGVWNEPNVTDDEL